MEAYETCPSEISSKILNGKPLFEIGGFPKGAHEFCTEEPEQDLKLLAKKLEYNEKPQLA